MIKEENTINSCATIIKYGDWYDNSVNKIKSNIKRLQQSLEYMDSLNIKVCIEIKEL